MDGGDAWTSTNGGATWTNQTGSSGATNQGLLSISSFADGTRLAITGSDNNPGDIYTSTDGGITWTDDTPSGSAHDQNWTSITSSADGTHLAAVVQGGDIWTAVLVFPPSVTTSAASSVSATSATGNGSITDVEDENPETVGFVYGATTAYGATTTENGSFSVGSFSANISSLTCNTAYHFAAYATNSGGTGYGSDQTLTTSACPSPAPSGGGGMIWGSGPLGARVCEHQPGNIGHADYRSNSFCAWSVLNLSSLVFLLDQSPTVGRRA